MKTIDYDKAAVTKAAQKHFCGCISLIQGSASHPVPHCTIDPVVSIDTTFEYFMRVCMTLTGRVG